MNSDKYLSPYSKLNIRTECVNNFETVIFRRFSIFDTLGIYPGIPVHTGHSLVVISNSADDPRDVRSMAEGPI